jgi:hypothetical protein
MIPELKDKVGAKFMYQKSAINQNIIMESQFADTNCKEWRGCRKLDKDDMLKLILFLGIETKRLLRTFGQLLTIKNNEQSTFSSFYKEGADKKSVFS